MGDKHAGRGALDPVVAAASVGFGVVYVHPFEDGNGHLSERARSGEFASLTDEEDATIELCYAESAADLPDAPAMMESERYARRNSRP